MRINDGRFNTLISAATTTCFFLPTVLGYGVFCWFYVPAAIGALMCVLFLSTK